MVINVNGVSREMDEAEEERFNEMIVDEAPTQFDALEAQVLYTAMMTDTLIED